MAPEQMRPSDIFFHRTAPISTSWDLLQLKKFMAHSLSLVAKKCTQVDHMQIAQIQKYFAKIIAEKMMQKNEHIDVNKPDKDIVAHIKKCFYDRNDSQRFKELMMNARKVRYHGLTIASHSERAFKTL